MPQQPSSSSQSVVAAGERIVVEGTGKLQPGAKVREGAADAAPAVK